MPDDNVLTIRRAEVRDAEAVQELWKELIRYHRSIEAFRPERWDRPADEVIGPRLAAVWEDPEHQAIFVAEQDGQPLGFVCTQLREGGPCPGNIDTLVVEAGERGQGVGRALLDAALSWCRANGAHEVSLDCIWPNRLARRFYESQGFRPLLVTYVWTSDR